MQVSGLGWGLMAGPFIVALAPQFGADVITTFAVVVSLGFGLGFVGYMQGKRPWWDAGLWEITTLERIGRVWCKITGKHIYRQMVPGVRQCRLCGWEDVDLAELWKDAELEDLDAAYKLE